MQHVVLLLLLVLVSHLFLIIESSGVAVGWCRLVAAEGWAPHVLLMGHRGSPHHSSHSGRCSVLWGCHNVCTDPHPPSSPSIMRWCLSVPSPVWQHCGPSPEPILGQCWQWAAELSPFVPNLSDCLTCIPLPTGGDVMRHFPG